MNNPRELHEDEPTDEEDELRRCDLADQYWADLQGNSCPDSRRWLGDRHIEEPAFIDDLEVISLLRLVSQSSELNGGEQRDSAVPATRTVTGDAFESPLSLPEVPANELANFRKPPERIGKYLVTGEPLGQGGQGQFSVWYI